MRMGWVFVLLWLAGPALAQESTASQERIAQLEQQVRALQAEVDMLRAELAAAREQPASLPPALGGGLENPAGTPAPRDPDAREAKVLRGLEDALQAMPAQLQPRPTRKWTRDEEIAVRDWLSHGLYSRPFEAKLALAAVRVRNRAPFDPQHGSKVSIEMQFLPVEVSYRGLTFVQKVDPLVLPGDDVLVNRAKQLKPGDDVRVRGTIRTFHPGIKVTDVTLHLRDASVTPPMR